MAGPVISLSGVSYRYPDGTPALDNISLEIGDGQSVAIVGPNGAGKSTLLLLMAGLIPASAGSVRVLGRAVDEKAVESARGLLWLRRKLGVVFQDPDVALFNPTVWKEVAFGPLHLDVPEKEVIHRTERALADMGISHLKDRAPHRLSEGEKRKVSIASVLSIRPDIILFDEPTAGLDPRSRKMIIRLLGRLSGQGKTVIVATHDLEVVPSFAERMVVVNRRVLACGMSRDILSDTRILDEAGLEAPAVARLFAILKENGFPVERLPFSPEEGAEILMGDGMVPGERGKLPGPK